MQWPFFNWCCGRPYVRRSLFMVYDVSYLCFRLVLLKGQQLKVKFGSQCISSEVTVSGT